MRARLFVLDGRDVGRSFEVHDGAVLGRAEECEVRLADRSISRRHARVRFDGEVWSVEDLESRNGLHKGGHRVRRVALEDMDEFELGELSLRFRLNEAQVDAEPLVLSVPDPAPLIVEEIHLESDDEPTTGTAAGTAPAARPLPVPEPPRATKSDRQRTDRERRHAELLRSGARPGLLGGDLGQRPAWVQALVLVILLALAGTAFFVAYRSVQLLRGGE